MDPITFTAKLIQHPGMDATYVEFPYNVQELFGTRGQVKIKASIDNALYRGILANMGGSCHVLIVTQAIRKQIGNKSPGDMVTISLVKDEEERVVEMPKVLQDLLDAQPEERDFFNSLSYTNRKEYVVWIESARKEETRIQRLAQTLRMLTEKKKNPTGK